MTTRRSRHALRRQRQSGGALLAELWVSAAPNGPRNIQANLPGCSGQQNQRLGSRRSRHARRRRRQSGGALLAVLWVSAALSAIVFSLAATVRSEFDRAASAVDSTRAYYLAQGGIERFLLHLAQGAGPNSPFRPGQRRLRWDFPSGAVDIEITGEDGKLSVYSSPPDSLGRLFVNLGIDGPQAFQIAGAIASARQSATAANYAPGSSFASAWPSFLQLEDLLKIGGLTREMYYGWWERDPEGRLVERGGLARHLTLIETGAVNVNYASAAVLRAAGVSEGDLAGLLQARESQVLDNFPGMGRALAGGVYLSGGGSSAYTVRATARLAGGRPIERSVEVLVRFGKPRLEPPLGIVRWFPSAN